MTERTKEQVDFKLGFDINKFKELEERIASLELKVRLLNSLIKVHTP